MKNTMVTVVLMVVLGFMLEFSCTAVEVFVVGDSAGWTTLGNTNYTAWSMSKTFDVGDILVFLYDNQSYNVLEVSRADYRECITSSPLESYTSGNDAIIIDRRGHHYFTSGFPGNCDSGMKLDVRIPNNATSPSPSPSVSPSPSMASPSPSVSPSPLMASPSPAPSMASPSPSPSPSPSMASPSPSPSPSVSPSPSMASPSPPVSPSPSMASPSPSPLMASPSPSVSPSPSMASPSMAATISAPYASMGWLVTLSAAAASAAFMAGV